MSNKKNDDRKSKRAKLNSNPIKKPVNNPPKKHNVFELNCNNCGVFIDNIKNYHYVFSDDFGEINVCGKCWHELTEKKLDSPDNSINPNTHSLQKSKVIISNINNPLFQDVPKIRLVFLNKHSNNNEDTMDNDSNTSQTSQKSQTSQTSQKKKEPVPTKGKNKDKEQKDDISRYFTSPNMLVGNNLSGCNSNECNHDQDDSGLLFFQQILNRINEIDKKNSNRATSNDEDIDTDTIEEDDTPLTPLEYEWLGDNIKNIDDLIAIGKSYDSRKRKRYNLNLKQLNNLVAPLEELKAMVGMADVKKIIFDQLIYYLQNLDDKNVDMLHTVITGPPGVGKTQLTHIIAKIYNRLGFLKTDKVVCAKRDDLIGEYVGQTAPKTRKVLERALGGVLLLDEIYSLAPTSDRDFAREAIDMINMYLSEHAHDLVCVVAGYKKPTYEKFFSQNEGLARRFTHHFEIKGYSHDELALIFKKYLESLKWSLGASLEDVSEIIKGHMELFPNFGGDMATLFSCCKKAHSRRLLLIPTEEELVATKKKIQKSDILEAVGIYKEIKEKHSTTDEEDKIKYMHMYS